MEPNGTRWCRGMFSALQPEDRKLESTSSHWVAILDKLLTNNCLRGRQWETTSLISSPGGVKANELAFVIHETNSLTCLACCLKLVSPCTLSLIKNSLIFSQSPALGAPRKARIVVKLWVAPYKFTDSNNTNNRMKCKLCHRLVIYSYEI